MRKQSGFKKFAKVLALSMALAMTVQTMAPVSTAAADSAATKTKLNVAKKSLIVGEKFTLKLNGTSDKVTFSSSRDSVAAVTSKGVVTAKKVGLATITATVGEYSSRKHYACKVTIKEKDVANAPFEAVKTKIGGATVVVPKAWFHEEKKTNGITVHSFIPEESDNSGIEITCVKTKGIENTNFDSYMEALKAQITVDSLKTFFSTWAGAELTVEDFSITEEKFPLGRVSVISYTVEQEGRRLFTEKDYYFFAAGYITEFTVKNDGTVMTPDIYETANYMMKTLTYTK